MTEYNLNGILFKGITTELKNGRVTVKSNVENNTGADLEAQVVEVTVYNEARTEKFVFQGHLQAMATGGTDQFNETHETSELSSVGDLEFAQIIEIADNETDNIKYSNIKILNNGESKSTIFMWVENNTSDVIPTGYYNFTLVDTSGKEVIVLSKYIDEIAVGQEIQVVLSSDELDYTAIKKVSSFKMEKEPIDTEKLREDVDELQVETTGIANELDLVKEDVADLKTASGEIGTDIDTIKTDLTNLTNKESAFEAATNKSISDLEKKHDKEVAEINTEISSLKTSDTGIKTDIVNIKEDIKGVKEDTKSNADDITLLKNKQSTLETNLVTANTKIESNSKGITDINKDITSIKKDVAQNKTDITDLQNEVKDLQRTDLTVKSDIINLKDADKEIKDDVKTLSNKVTTLENKQTSSTDDVSTLKEEVAQLKVGMGKVVDKNTDQTVEINKISNRVDTVEEKVADMRNAVRDNTTNIASVKENVTELLKETPKIQNKVTSLENDVKDINDELPTVKKGVENNTEYIREVEETAEDNKSRLDTLEPKVQENAANILLNKSAIENTEAEVEAVKTNITDIKDSMDGIREDIDALEEKHDEDISNVDEKMGKQEDDLNEAQKEITQMVEDILNLADRVKALEDEDPITPVDPDVPTSPSTLEKLVKAYLEEHINNLLCVIIPRHDTSSNWSLNDPILSFGEYGVEDDTHRIKRGDGVHKWADLDYESFGLENLIATTAAEISYDNKETGISKIDVQAVLDYLIENLISLRQEVDLKEVIKNKVYKIEAVKVNDVTYPSTKAVYEYIQNLMKDKTLVPTNPETGTYSLISKNGVMSWTRGGGDSGEGDHEQVIENTEAIEELQTETAEIKTNVATLETKTDEIEESVDTLNTKVDTVKTSVEANTSDINSLKTNVTTINEQVSNIATDVGTLTTGVNDLDVRTTTNESAIEDNKASITQNTSDIADLQGSLEVATDDINQSKEDIEDLQDSVETIQETMVQKNADTNYLQINNENVSGTNLVYKTDAETGDTISVNDRLDTLETEIQSAGKVDKVNNIAPDENKNITLDASNINVDETAETKKTVKETLEGIYLDLDQLETEFDSKVDDERTTRETEISSLQSDLNTETTNRTNADTTLQTNIDNEATAREEADAVLDERIDNETTERETADAAIRERIDDVEKSIEDLDIPEYSIVESTTTEGYAKTYSLTKDGEEVGTKINIPKDLVVKSGSVKVATEKDKPYDGAEVGDRYVDLELNDKDKDHIYIAVKDLVDVYTGVDGDKIKVIVNGDNSITAEIKSGTIEKTDLTSALQNEIDNKLDKYSDDSLMGKFYVSPRISNSSEIGIYVDNAAGIKDGKISKAMYGTYIDGSDYFSTTNTRDNSGLTIRCDDSKGVKMCVESEQIVFKPETSGLTSIRIAPAIRELATKILDAGKVNTINGIEPDTNKNVQVDASQINMDDSAETKTTVKAKIEALNTIVAEQAATITEQNEKIAAQDEKIAEMKELIGDIKTVLEYINTGNTELEEVDGVLDQIIGNEG